MTKKKVGKPQIAETKRLSRSVPARLYPHDLERLLDYEKVGLNMSDIIRRCVNRSLDDVVSEIRDGIQQVSKPT